MARKIGIITGGGDCPGINAVIATLVKVGTSMGYEFIGFERGWEGVLDPPMHKPLDVESVKGISWLGGTILHTTSRGRFAAKVGEGEQKLIPEEILNEAKANLESLGVEGLIVIGGDGTLAAANQLSGYGIRIVGVPKTIDNDLNGTDRTFGFSTAVDVVVEALDRIHVTATSHERTFVVECMGRNAGWIALAAGVAGGANAILMPEFPFTVDSLVQHIRYRRDRHERSTIILIAEGTRIDDVVTTVSRGDSQEVRFVGVSETLMNEIEARTKGEFEIRNVVLGHTQRGASPNAEDRTLAKRYGVAAMEAYDAGKYGQMVCLSGGLMGTCPIAEAIRTIKRVPADTYEFHVAERLGIFLRG